MGCHSNQFAGAGNYSNDGCVKSVVRRILDAQRKAVDSESDMCATSCERSIEDLLSPVLESRPRRRHTTIPFMLTCKHTCRPFVGTGISNRVRGGGRRGHFECVESPIFKVKGFAGGSDNCAKLELLLPVHHRGDGHSDEDVGHGHHGKDCCGGSVCSQFSGKHIHNFRETGICITVDLDNFTGITCLDPITPIRY